MAAFASLDKRMRKDLEALHDHLWAGSKAGGDRLRPALLRDAHDLDAFLAARGKLQRSAERLVKSWDDDAAGASLFEILHDAYHLTAATEHVRKQDYKGAGEHVAWAVESTSIGLCSSLGAFHIVDAWEHRGGDFEAYASSIADLLESKGVARAGEFKRHLLAARMFGKDFDASAPPQVQSLGARMALLEAAWLGATGLAVRASLGRPPAFPAPDYAAVLERIVSRV